MSSSRLTQLTPKIPALSSFVTAIVIILLPFHAFLTVWLSSGVGHYTLLRLWKEVLLVLLSLGTMYLLIVDKSLRKKLVESRLNQTILAYIFITIIWGIAVYMLDKVTTKALGYGLIVDLRFPIFFLVIWVAATKAPKVFAKWPNWIWWPLGIVIVLGLLQYFALPYNELSHFGYGEQTIFPYETINHNVNHIRVFSTLRGANPLGAYLVLVLSLLIVFWQKQMKNWQTVLLAGGIGVLFLSFSRSAWIGLAISASILAWCSVRSKKLKQRALMLAAAGLVVLAGLGFALRHNTTFQDLVFHTNDRSTIQTSSNDGHASALRGGLGDIATEPLGEGPGSAGPASVYNDNKVRIAEDYFIQIGQETGWPGLLFFLLITLYLANELWQRRQSSLALGLFAALAGLTFVNLLSHAWVDDTLAYIFWGLAAIALATERPGQVK